MRAFWAAVLLLLSLVCVSQLIEAHKPVSRRSRALTSRNANSRAVAPNNLHRRPAREEPEARTLIVSTLDGIIHAFDADTGRELWKRSTGMPLVSSYQPQHLLSPPSAGSDPRAGAGVGADSPTANGVYIDADDADTHDTSPSHHHHHYRRYSTGSDSDSDSDGEGDTDADADADATTFTPDPIIIPSPTGQVFTFSDNKMHDSVRVKEIVERSPMKDSRGTFYVGSQSTRLYAVGMRRGRLYNTVEATSFTCPTEDDGPGLDRDDDDPDDVVIWLGRRDFSVQAFDGERMVKQRWNLTIGEMTTPSFTLGESTAQFSANTLDLDLSLSATTDGKMFATHLSTGAAAWGSTVELGSAPSAMYIFSASGQPQRLEFTQFWPQATPVGPDGRGSHSGPTALTQGHAAVFIGVTPTGQLFAMPNQGLTQLVPTSAGPGAGAPSSCDAGGTCSAGADPHDGDDTPPVGGDQHHHSSDRPSGGFPELPAPDDVDSPPPEVVPPPVCDSLCHNFPQCLLGVHNVTVYEQVDTLGKTDGSTPPFNRLPSGFDVDGDPASEPAGLWQLPWGLAGPQALFAVMSFTAVVVGMGTAWCMRHQPAPAVPDLRLPNNNNNNNNNNTNNNTSRSSGRRPRTTTAADDDDDAGPIIVEAPLVVPEEPTEVVIDDVAHQRIGKLAVSGDELGRGCHGTIVYRGYLGRRPVAIKSMLQKFVDSADNEITMLIKSDGHPNVVKYFHQEHQGDFIHLALELCRMTLSDAVARCARERAKVARREARRLSRKQFQLAVPPPSERTRRFLYELMSGVAHLHKLGIVHRDLKPQNILLAHLEQDGGGGGGGGGGGPPATSTSPGGRVGAGAGAGGGGGGGGRSTKPKLPPHLKEYHRLGIDWRAKISDMGLGKQLAVGQSSYSATEMLAKRRKRRASGLTDGSVGSDSSEGDEDEEMGSGGGVDSLDSSVRGVGTSGWKAPEVIELSVQRSRSGRGVVVDAAPSPTSDAESKEVGVDAAKEVRRRTRAVDVWSLGCLLYHVVDAGGHPFGEPVERDANVLHNRVDLSQVEHLPQLHDLVRQMIDTNPARRPKARKALEHPFFWDDTTRLAFLQDVSDWINGLPDSHPCVVRFERNAVRVCGRDWRKRLPTVLLDDAGLRRRYSFSHLRDLLRLLRNKKNHFVELSESFRATELHGDTAASLVAFFAARGRFPHLFMECYNFVLEFKAHDPLFAAYLGRLTARDHASASRSALDAAEAAASPVAAVDGGGGGGGGSSTSSVLRSQSRGGLPLRRSGDGAGTSGGGGGGGRLAQFPTVGDVVKRRRPRRGGGPRGWFLSPSQWMSNVGSVAQRAITLLDPVTNVSMAAAPGDDATGPQRGLFKLTAANGNLRETKFKGGAHVGDARYKSKPCHDWVSSGGDSCPRGVRCDFAHGELELRGSLGRRRGGDGGGGGGGRGGNRGGGGRGGGNRRGNP